MKLLTKEEENAHYSSVVRGGTFGGLVGLAGGAAGVLLAARRFHTIRNLTLPMKAFLVTSSGTFVGIIAADHASRSFEAQHNAEKQWFENREERLRAEEIRSLSFTDRAVAFARREKYKIVTATWIASMVGSFVLVGRNPYLSGQQKIVQARVYAQGLTLGVFCASAAFEMSDRRRGQGLLNAAKSKEQAKREAENPEPKTNPNQEEGDLWKDMVAAEEQRLKSKHQSLYQKHEEAHAEAKQEAEEKKDSESSEEKKEDDKAQSKEEPKAEKSKSA